MYNVQFYINVSKNNINADRFVANDTKPERRPGRIYLYIYVQVFSLSIPIQLAALLQKFATLHNIHRQNHKTDVL